MNTFNPVQFAVINGVASIFDHIESEGPMWRGTGKRWARAAVRFPTSFVLPPVVQLSLAMIDADSGRNLRLELTTEDVSRGGFTAVAHTWSDTRIGRLQLNWTAFGQGTVAAEPLWDV
ncbi:MAG: H-type lectin domain-containing protein [Paracoccaceae bacterium]